MLVGVLVGVLIGCVRRCIMYQKLCLNFDMI